MLPFSSDATPPPSSQFWGRPLVFCMVVVLGLHSALQACSVPVFRYGLEHWTADPYQVLVVHRGPLAAEFQALASSIKQASARANLTVSTVDLARQQDPEMLETLKSIDPAEAPVIVALPPKSARDAQAVWSAPLTPENIARLIDSPARKLIASRLGEGESAVFVLLESGDKASDDAAADLLQARLAYLGSVLELPKLDEQDIRNGLVSVPPDGLHLAFSVVRISRADPAEQAFTQMLLATEPDLRQASGPMAFPVFGQGRALYALVGKGIKHETIDEAASFLIGSCSCQVKEKNPGADLLMAVDWKGLMQNQAIELKDLPAASEIIGGMPETVKIAPAPPSDPSGSASQPEGGPQLSNNRMVILGSAAVLAVIVLAGIALGKKRSR